MSPSTDIKPLSWSRRAATVNLLLAMAEQQKEIGRRIAQLREARGLTQEDLAHASNVRARTLSRLENGHHEARASTIRNIAEALKVEPREITGQAPPPSDDRQLGDGMSQLDRIEAKLDLLLSHQGLTYDLEDPGEQFARELDAVAPPSEQRGGSSA